MLEVVFDDSAKAAMMYAKNYTKGIIGIGISVVAGEMSLEEIQDEINEHQERRTQGKAIGGSSQDVACIGFALDVGDINCDIDSQERKNEFLRVFGHVDFSEEAVDHFFTAQRNDFDKLLDAAKSGGSIRVWKSSAPFSACAFAFLCDSLRDISCNISAISLPVHWDTSENAFCCSYHWADIDPGQFYKFLPMEKQVTPAEKKFYGDIWRSLKAENAPLRALLNGILMSVPEDFYDHIIAQNIPDGEFIMARLIGTILGKYPLGVGDGWYSLRIKKMIAENRLEIVDDKDQSHPYGKVLRKKL